MKSNSAEQSRLQAVLEKWLVAAEQGERIDLLELCGGDETLAQSVRDALASESSAWSMLSAPPLEGALAIPRSRLGQYRLLRSIGRGGMATVYLAEDLSLPRLVALKVFDESTFREPKAVERFRREAEITAALEHPNIVPVYSIGEDAGVLFIAMKYLSGPPLDQLEKSLSARETARLGVELASALHSAHELGILHRDIKPANVLLEGEHPILVDFGLAKGQGDVALTQTGAVPGTLCYMAPEALQRGSLAFSPGIDIYSLGATLYEICAGHPCFDSADPERLIHRVLMEDAPRLRVPQEDVDFATIVEKCLQKLPHSRYATMEELRIDLALFLEKKPIRAKPLSRLERTARLVRRNPRTSAILGLSLVGILGLSTSLVTRVLRERTAVRLAVESCERSIAGFDVDSARAALGTLLQFGRSSDHDRLERQFQGLVALDEALDSVQLTYEALDLERLSTLVDAIVDSKIIDVHEKMTCYALCLAYFQLSKPTEAAQQLAKARSRFGDTRATTALGLLLDGQIAAASSDTIAEAIEHIFAFHALRLSGASNDAMRVELDLARKLAPTDHRVQFAHAVLLDLEGDFSAARAAFRSLERPGRSALAMIRTSALESLRLGEIDVALAEMARIPESERCPIDAKNALAAFWQAGKLEEFDTALERAEARWPGSAEIKLLRIARLQSRSDWAEAVHLSQRALELPANYLAHDRAQAELARSRFHEIGSRNPPSDRQEALVQLGRDIDQIANTVRDTHARSILSVARGRIAASLGDPEGAIERFRAAISIEPQDAVAHLALAQLQYSLIQGQLKEAASRGDAPLDPSIDQKLRERTEEARQRARSVLAMRNRAKLPFSPQLLVTAAKLEGALAVRDNDKNGCLAAAEIGLLVCDEHGLPDRTTFANWLDWARK